MNIHKNKASMILDLQNNQLALVPVKLQLHTDKLTGIKHWTSFTDLPTPGKATKALAYRILEVLVRCCAAGIMETQRIETLPLMLFGNGRLILETFIDENEARKVATIQLPDGCRRNGEKTKYRTLKTFEVSDYEIVQPGRGAAFVQEHVILTTPDGKTIELFSRKLGKQMNSHYTVDEKIHDPFYKNGLSKHTLIDFKNGELLTRYESLQYCNLRAFKGKSSGQELQETSFRYDKENRIISTTVIRTINDESEIVLRQVKNRDGNLSSFVTVIQNGATLQQDEAQDVICKSAPSSGLLTELRGKRENDECYLIRIERETLSMIRFIEERILDIRPKSNTYRNRVKSEESKKGAGITI